MSSTLSCLAMATTTISAGSSGFCSRTRSTLKGKLPFYVGGEECFCSREWVGPPVAGDFGALDREALEQAHLS